MWDLLKKEKRGYRGIIPLMENGYPDIGNRCPQNPALSGFLDTVDREGIGYRATGDSHDRRGLNNYHYLSFRPLPLSFRPQGEILAGLYH